MPRIRLFAAGAVAMVASALAAGSAPAQSSAAASPGSPLQLLQMLRTPGQPQQTTTKHHAKWLARRTTRSAVASARHQPLPVQTEAASAETPAGVWPTPASVPPVGFVAAEAEPLAASATREGPVPGDLVVGGQMVKVASPGDLNEIDVAANNTEVPFAAAVANDTAPDPATNPPAANFGSAEAAPKSDSLMSASASPPPAASVGSASWIAQVLAALGGAVAAGSAAWFLIGATPQRMYS